MEAVRQWRVFHSPNISDVCLIVDPPLLPSDGNVTLLSRELSIELVDSSTIRTPEWEAYLHSFYVQG